MGRIIEYYFSMHSPWAYIGHIPLCELMRRFSLNVTYKPISLPKVFAETGGVPVTKVAWLNCSAGARSGG